MNKPRILLVDDNQRIIQDNKKNLNDWGYEAVILTGIENFSEEELCQEAQKLAVQQACHLALIDLRILNNTNSTDESGLEVVKALKPIPSIILTGHLTISNLKKVLEIGALTAVEKLDGPRALHEIIQKHLPQYCCHARTNFKIHYFGNAKENINLLNSLVASHDEIEELLSRLFPESGYLEIATLSESFHTPTSISQPSSLILKVRHKKNDGMPPTQPILVKIAREESINREMENYENFVHGHIRGQFHTQLQKKTVAWNLGALRLTYQGGQEQVSTFSHFYTDKDVKTTNITRNLRLFFTNSWGELYKTTQLCSVITANAYADVWDKGKKNQPERFFRTRLKKATKQDIPALDIPNFIVDALPSPFLWVNKNWEKSPVCKQYAVTHGDLHGDNLIIGQEDGLMRVIDFERTGYGPILQDFTELEGDILVRLVEWGWDSSANSDIFSPEQYLVNLSKLYQSRKLKPQPNKDKTTKTIVVLRKIAESHHNDTVEYYWGVLLNAVYRLLFLIESNKQSYKQLQYQRAYLLAAILCDRFDHWDERDWDVKLWKRIKDAEKKKRLQEKFYNGYAVVIGVGDDLPATINDAKQLHTLLIDEKLSAYPKEQTYLLVGNQAIPDNIKIVLRWLTEEVNTRPNATVFIYFSGHGVMENGKYALVGFGRTLLYSDELQTLLNAIPAKLILILDTCYAGGMANTKGENSLAEEKVPPIELLEQLKATDYPRVILSSSRNDQKSWITRNGSQSIYTHFLLEEMRRVDPLTDFVSFAHLLGMGERVTKKVQEEYGVQQVPWCKSASSSFPIALRPSRSNQ